MAVTPVPSPSEVPLIPPHTPLHGWIVIVLVFSAFIALGMVRLGINRRWRNRRWRNRGGR